VAQQDLDNANGNLEAKLAAVESARANVRRLEQLQAFRRIEAPFAGVVTARNIDIGALIDSGSNAKELFHVAAINRLRVFINVPEVYSRVARPGLAADLTLREFPGRRFAGTLARTSNAIDVASRTLLTEVDVDNPKGELLPGSYAEVHIKLATAATTLKLPVDALIFKADGLQVATVGGDNRVALVTVVAGRDFGDTVEILSGLSGGERVVANPPDSLTPGEVVRIVAPAGPGAQR
jgi:RND family efflux transporter MFP subunit